VNARRANTRQANVPTNTRQASKHKASKHKASKHKASKQAQGKQSDKSSKHKASKQTQQAKAKQLKCCAVLVRCFMDVGRMLFECYNNAMHKQTVSIWTAGGRTDRQHRREHRDSMGNRQAAQD
jgi:hypothetical protein